MVNDDKMVYKLDINDRAANAIKNGTKRVEIRANKINSEFDYSNIKKDDIIEFNSDMVGKFYVKVIENNYYDTIEELLMLEGTRYTTSSTNNYDEAISNIYKLDGYKDAIKKNGVFAIHIKYLYGENTVWNELYEKAKEIRNSREISGMISAGAVGAAILTENHNIYVGVCIDTASSLGMCAERNAIANMITNGESKIKKLVCVDSKGNVVYLCGVCREYLMQLDKESKNIEILKDIETKEVIKLEELIPNWWGYDRV